ncbi:MAG: ATP-binding cassette domain-containing protein [Burkholderiaceae bacterium]|nr:ATP-binding cassette domain-containing protein [Burkholderiaceae bacterium]MBP7660775.1 ATP-binding cassette domain-containing protein [Burkholderiaceae bacterium]
MALLTVQSAELAYGHHALLAGVDLSIETGERIGLIGRNGTGKSSLLKALAGLAALDAGEVRHASGTRIAYLPQEPTFEPGVSIREAITGALAGDLDDHDAWSATHRVDAVLSRFGLDGEPLVQTLSGGMRKRVALAQAMVREPELLLLDEPTNHLDIEAIVWLEGVLRSFRGSLLMITHDRRFLDSVATRIIELDRGQLRSYPGDFATYLKRKADELASEALERARFDKMLSQEEVWIRKGVEARRTRNEGRVRRLQALRVQREARRERIGSTRLEVDAGEKSGKLVAELTDVQVAYGDHVVLRDLNCIIQRGDRVGIVGANGAGKTTLLRTLLGDLTPTAGKVKLGSNRQVAYFDQLREQLDPDAAVADTISPGSEWVEIAGQRIHVMSYLERFLFEPARARSPVRTLSGGERNRLLLARLFARPANVLVLDEPTNDLDIDTLELLEELLDEYPGTLLLVSHDRAFLDAVVTQTLAHEGGGHWREYAGGWSDVEAARSRQAQAAANAQAGGAPAGGSRSAADNRDSSGGNGAAGARREPARAKLSYKEQRELDALPQRIADLEAEQKQLAARLADPSTYQAQGTGDTGAGALKAMNERVSAIEEELLGCLERWETLEARKG